MSAIVRKTYDTDSIVLRRIFAVDPTTNTRVSTNSILATSSNGVATFQDGSAFLSTIGVPTSELLQSTIVGLGTIGYISSGGGGGGGSGDVTSTNLTSTTQGLGTLSYISSAQLISSMVGLSNLVVSRIVAGTNITINPTTGIGAVTINATASGSGDVTSTNLTSTTLGLGTLGYISSQQLTSTVQGLGTINYISSSQLLSSVAGISKTFSTVYYISDAGGINISGPTTGFYINNTNANISTLINNNITINQSGGNVNDVDLVSTTLGLATFGYLSSASNLVSTPLLTSSLISTVRGLGTLGYLSTAVTKIIAGTNITIDPTQGEGIVTINASGGGGGGGSGDVTSTNLTSTTLGLGTLGYVSSSTLFSTVAGLGLLGYISSPTLASSLTSTVRGLGTTSYVSSTALNSTVLGISRFYVSTTGLASNLSSFSTSMASNFFTRTLTASTITADLLNISTISFGTGAGFITFPFVRASYVSTLSTQMDFGLVNTYLSGPRLVFSSLQGDGSLLTNLSTGLLSTVQGLGSAGYISTLTLNSTLQSTVEGLATSGYISSLTLNSTLQSTVEGLATSGYISSLTLKSTLLSTVEGLGSAGYVSTLGLDSAIENLGKSGYISSLTLESSLQSTVAGLGTASYFS